jgi:hypothetical protein
MSDGNHIYAAESPEEIIDLLQKGQGVFAIALDRVREDLEGSIARRRERRPGSLAKAGGA